MVGAAVWVVFIGLGAGLYSLSGGSVGNLWPAIGGVGLLFLIGGAQVLIAKRMAANDDDQPDLAAASAYVAAEEAVPAATEIV